MLGRRPRQPGPAQGTLQVSVGAAVKLVHISFFVVLSSVPCEDGFRDMNIIKNDLSKSAITS